MTIRWSDLLAKFKRRLSRNDVTRIVTHFARAGLDVEPVATCIKRLHKHNWRTDWFPTEWRQQLDPSLQRISIQDSRNAQGLMCRRELLVNTEKVALNDFLVVTGDDDIRDFWLSEKYADVDDLDSQKRFELLVVHYLYSLLNQLGLEGLHWQQFNSQVNIDEIVDPFRAICGMYVETLCRTLFAEAMLEANRDDLELLATSYLAIVSKPYLREIREAKDDYAAWIGEGNTEGFGRFRERFRILLSSLKAADQKLKDSKRD